MLRKFLLSALLYSLLCIVPICSLVGRYSTIIPSRHQIVNIFESMKSIYMEIICKNDPSFNKGSCRASLTRLSHPCLLKTCTEGRNLGKAVKTERSWDRLHRLTNKQEMPQKDEAVVKETRGPDDEQLSHDAIQFTPKEKEKPFTWSTQKIALLVSLCFVYVASFGAVQILSPFYPVVVSVGSDIWYYIQLGIVFQLLWTITTITTLCRYWRIRRKSGSCIMKTCLL